MAKQVTSIFSHWYKLVENFNYSTQEFYKQVENALEQRNVPGLKVSRVSYREKGPLSAKREYLRLSRYENNFDLCAAPFGSGFFVSWWLGQAENILVRLISAIPFFGELFLNLARPMTYYQIDTALMFQESVHLAVMEVFDQILKGKGMRALTEGDKKPIMKELYS